MNTYTKDLLQEATRAVMESDPRYINYVGKKPWYERSMAKFKFAVVAGLTVGVLGGLGISSLLDTPEKNEEFFSKPFKTEYVQIDFDSKSAVSYLRAEYPGINFEKMKNKRDVAKEFVGVNNFIALAAEMEGFRGDLHKDPAVGLNIGFGYNISKRVGSSTKDVENDLSSIGISENKIKDIISLAKMNQDDLSFGINKFNNKYKLKNGKLITLEQGVALLRKTQGEYKRFANLVFEDSFSKMRKNQQEVLTYAAYKVGMTTLSKYKSAIITASEVYDSKKTPNTDSLKLIAKELTFFYSKDGKKRVLDDRASLIAHTFVHQDYLSAELGEHDKLKNSMRSLMANKIDFKKELKSKNVAKNVKSVRDKIRGINAKSSKINNLS